MSSYGQVAAQVAERKRLNPEQFCRHPKCLWHTATSDCVKPGHNLCPQCRLDISGGKDHHEGCMYFS